ncbi:MAG TPA: hypothetical protein VER83_05110, partial [Candidatus Nanopelagicales bacterium]|nr:hypothetical protein [Candidatus Nanopelagicales bacterium]
RDVLAAHRLEAAYFYPPDAPKIAALSFGNPLGLMGGMTIGYTAGAALIWLAGLTSTGEYLATRGDSMWAPDILASLVVPAAIAWTAVIAAYLAWTFLRRADEDRLLVALDDAYRLPAPPPEPAPASGPGSTPEPASKEPSP